MIKNIVTLFIFLMLSTNLYSIDFKQNCYRLNEDLNYRLTKSIYGNVDSVEQLIDEMLTWMKGRDGSRPCDKIEFVSTIPIKTVNKGVTVQSMTKETSSSGNVDFISIEPVDDSYFVGFSSKNFGIGTGYIITKKLSFDKNGNQNITYVLEHVNMEKYFADRIEEYCKLYNNPPNIVNNSFAFTNFVNIYLSGQSIADTEANAAQMRDSGMLLLDDEICKDRRYIIEKLNEIVTHQSGGTKGWDFSSLGNTLFRNHGFIINYPYISGDKIDNIIGSYFADIMYNRDIQRGILFSDTIVDIKTRHWTKKKRWWSRKKDYVSKKLTINSESYDIVYSSIPLPFEETSLTTNWPNSEMTYVTTVNPFPSLNDNYISYTADNHITTHAFRKNGEIESLGSYQYYKVKKKTRSFNWTLFIAIIAVVVVTSIFTFGSGFSFAGNFLFNASSGAAFGTAGSWATSSVALGILGSGATLSATGVAIATAIGSMVAMPLSMGSGIHVGSTQISHIVRNAYNDIIESGSVKVTSMTMIPDIIEKLEPVRFVSGSAYRSIVSYSKNEIDPSEWNDNYGTIMNYVIYQNRKVKIGTFFDDQFVRNLYNNIYMSGFFIDGDPQLFSSKRALKEIMSREWNGSLLTQSAVPQPMDPVEPGADDTPVDPQSIGNSD